MQGIRPNPQPGISKPSTRSETVRDDAKSDVFSKLIGLPGLHRADELERSIREFQSSRFASQVKEPEEGRSSDVIRQPLVTNGMNGDSQKIAKSFDGGDGTPSIAHPESEFTPQDSELAYAKVLMDRIRQEFSGREPEEVAKNFHFIAKNNLMALLD